ncbi:MAG: 5-oxoprolinase subunit PxpA [Flavobacteriaceae bacterium]|nr:5-oxoprolinase subunit PxpA [Flavobacteriaceae bacterium]
MNPIYDTIDLNADVGEGIGNEPELLPLVSSCNIACGAHAGNRKTILDTMLLAKKHQVRIGAHPSYPDKENFGRKSIQMSSKDFRNIIGEQLGYFEKLAQKAEVSWKHIKAHGALYNDLSNDLALAKMYLEEVQKYGKLLVVPSGSIIEKLAIQSGLGYLREGFADRAYHTNLKLVSRSKPGAVLHNKKLILKRLLLMIHDKQVHTVEGNLVSIEVDTVCVHGDNKAALEILVYLREELAKERILIQ